jgi:hypothetical protein
VVSVDRLWEVAMSQARLIAILGVTAALVAAAFPIYMYIQDQRSKSVGGYQDQVAATCRQAREVLTRDRTGEVTEFRMNARGVTQPTDLLIIRKAALLSVMRENLGSVRQYFADLNSRDVPDSLHQKHRAAVAAQQAWVTARQRAISTVSRQVRDRDPLSKLVQLSVTIGAGTSTADVRLNSAMTTLAGQNCKITA